MLMLLTTVTCWPWVVSLDCVQWTLAVKAADGNQIAVEAATATPSLLVFMEATLDHLFSLGHISPRD